MTTQTPTEALAEAWAVVRGPYSDHRDISALLAALRTRGYTVAPIGAAASSQGMAITATPSALAAVEALRADGWTVVAPADPNAAIPTPQAGQVWVSPKPRVEARTVVRVGAHGCWPWAGATCVSFTWPGSDKRAEPRVLGPQGWLAWVRKSGARPQETGV